LEKGSAAMLRVTNLAVRYGHVRAVNGISFEIAGGELVALLGGNGAGKTTTLNAISGLLPAAAGIIEFHGESLVGLPPHEVVARGVIHVPEGRHIFPNLTVRENLAIGAYQRKTATNEDLDSVFALFPVLKERLGQAGQTLSGGEQQMLAIGRALMAQPKLLMLDEPSLGLAPIIVDRLFEQILQIKQQITILLVDQNAQLALELADRAYILQQGHIVDKGTGEDLLRSGWLEQAYLGTAERKGAADAAR
jgi:branched-chain amino acid transport system ATP-binding protein